MKTAITVRSVTHLVETGCADLLVEGILKLQAERDDETKATFEAIKALQKARDEIARLQEDNSRLTIEVKRMTTALRTCDRIIKPLRDKAAKDGKPSVWQPIETAPKDGTWLMLATDTPDKPSGIESLDCWFPAVCFGRYVKGSGWMRCSEYSVNIEPTHWQRHPIPPTKDNG